MNRVDPREILQSVGLPSIVVLDALRTEIGLSDFVMSRVVGRSAQTVRRWRKSDPSMDLPHDAAAAIDDLRAIVSMLIKAGYDGSTIRSFLRSRNTGLGQDRPLDGIRVGVSAFRQVEHVTECFIAGIAPEPGSALTVDEGEQFQPAVIEPSDPEPTLPKQSVGSRS